MKRWKWTTVAICLLLLVGNAMAAGPNRTSWQTGTQILDNTTVFDANSMLMFVTNQGSFAYDKTKLYGKNDGLYFPKGTNKSVIYAGGIWVGAKVGGEVRVTVAEYSNEFVPGPMLNGTFQSDRGSFRVYKVNKGDTRDNNPDYANWPFDDGAPAVKATDGTDSLDADGFRIPFIQGDQSLWNVFNDANPSAHDNNAGASTPMGLEIHNNTFGYARAGALGQTIFMRYTLINKGTNTLEDTYISLWSDPDLGDAGDDFVGCDTLLSLGFVYNDGSDGIYGDAPPAAGYDFFQGPIVLSAGDSAWVSGKGMYIQGYKNLPMTSFNKYINGTDPTSKTQSYNYMQGLSPSGEPQVDDEGVVTKFVLAGDPVAGTGWLDQNSADRRFMMSSGPFTMAPGDTQEVVAAVVVAQGASLLGSITELKRTDEIAQSVFDLNFKIPGPPPQPTVWAVPLDESVQLFWGLEADGDVQYGYGPPDETGERPILQTFVMEGFNVWQGASSSGPWTKIATYDVNNDVERIYMDQDNPDGKERVVIQRGTNTGLEHDLLVTQDRINGGSLINNRPYFFTVTSYNYDDQNKIDFTIGQNSFGIIAESFENLAGSQYAEMVPRSMTGVLSESAEHTAGGSDGSVVYDVIDPNLLTGDTYQVTFDENGWKVNVVGGGIVLANQTAVLSSEPVDGFLLRVRGPEFGVKSVAEVATAAGPIAPDNVNDSPNSTGDWYMDPGGDHGFSRYSWQGATDHDYEIRWTETAEGHCWDWFGEGDYSYEFPATVPVEIWDITDDRRITFMIIDDDGSDDFSWGDGLYIWDIDYDDVAWGTGGVHSGQYDGDYAGLHYGRFWFYDLSEVLTRPDGGTIIRVSTNKPNVPGDVFEFTTTIPGTADGTVIAESVDNVHPVPNPYYNLTDLEKDQFDRQIKFVNLPAAETTIRIFNLAGDLVRTLVKDDLASAEYTWDGLTETGIPVASGLYIYHVEATGLGTKIGKLAVFTEVEQLNTY